MNSSTFSELAYQKKQDIEVSKSDVVRINKIIDFVGSGKKVLDLGSVGDWGGETTRRIKDAGNEVWAADMSDSFDSFFAEHGIVFTKTNLEEKFPYTDGMFDVVVAGEIIEHLADTDNFVKEIKRVLKKDGYAIISTPNVVSLGRRINMILGKNAFFEASFGYPSNAAGHLRYFTFGLLQNFLKFHGLVVVKRTSDCISMPLNLTNAFFADIFPSLGRSIIVKVVKETDL